MENTKYGRRREGRWTPIRAKAQDTRANPSSWETHLVRKRWDIGLLRASSSLLMMMMMMMLDLKHCPARRKSDPLPPGRVTRDSLGIERNVPRPSQVCSGTMKRPGMKFSGAQFADFAVKFFKNQKVKIYLQQNKYAKLQMHQKSELNSSK